MLRSASPKTRVDSTRDLRISSWWSGVLMQLTLRPARLIKPTAPPNSCRQDPRVRPSHAKCRHEPVTFGLLRDTITTEAPRAARWCAREMPRKPLPPVMTTFWCSSEPDMTNVEKKVIVYSAPANHRSARLKLTEFRPATHFGLKTLYLSARTNRAS